MHRRVGSGIACEWYGCLLAFITTVDWSTGCSPVMLLLYVICTREVGVISEDGRNSPESNQNKTTLTSHLAQKTPKEASVARLGTGRREKEGGENRHITDAPGMSSSSKVASQQAENRQLCK